MKVGFAGLGLMGAPMALDILKAGYELVVFSRSAEWLRRFFELGVVEPGRSFSKMRLCCHMGQ